MPEFYVIIAQKIYFPEFWGTRGPLPPVSYAYARVKSIQGDVGVTMHLLLVQPQLLMLLQHLYYY